MGQPFHQHQAQLPTMPDPSHDSFLSQFLTVQGDLRAFIGAVVRDLSLEDDLFQEIALTLWKNFDKYDPSRSFGAWARGVAATKIKEDSRLRARAPQAYPDEVIEAVARGFTTNDADGGWSERENALRQCLAGLPDNARKLITERYGQDHSIDSIAAGFCLSAEAVYQALSRVRKQLRECIIKRMRDIFDPSASDPHA